MRIFRTIQILTLVAVFATAAVVGVWEAFASTVTSANDYPSTLQTSQAANHRALFTTPTGVSEGSTITLTFASSFDTSTLTEDDVDVADDGTDLTTAANCSGLEQASVAIASDVVTITICAGDGGTITAASSVAVEIGTNATSSGTGANRITNPTSTGNYYVAIGGTFGDSGSIILPIGGDDSVSVTATVPSISGGGGSSGDGDSSDTTAPEISNIIVSGVTTISATISWTTSEPTTRFLDYGLTSGFELGTATVSGYFTNHSVDLTGLTQGATYLFRIRAADINGNAATSSTQTFTTLDETDPVISNIEVIDITTTSARVTWVTDELANSTVSYGTNTSYGLSLSDSSLATSHSMLLTGLSAGTTYHFQVLSTDASSNLAFSSDQTFATDEDEAPGNVSALSIVAGNEELALSWVNPSDDDLVGIHVLRCLSGFPVGHADSACEVVSSALTQGLTQTELANGTTYYFGVFAQDAAGQFASGALVSGTPQAPEEEVPSKEEPTQDEEPSEEPGGEEDEPPFTPGSGVDEEEDADEVPPPDFAVSCGDGVCSLSESFASCPLDCGEPEEPTFLGAQVGTISAADLLYLVANQSLALTASRSGVVEVLPTSTLRIALPAAVLSDGVQTIVLDVGSDRYLMRLDDALALYSADLTVPREPAIVQVSVLVTYDDGSMQSVSSYLRVVSRGSVFQVIDGEEMGIETAKVTLFELDGEFVVWDGSPYGQFNPTSVDGEGNFAWYVPGGTYRVTATAPGFASASSTSLRVDNAIVAPRILLAAIKQEEPLVVEAPPQEASPEAPATTLAQTFLESLPIEAAQQSLEAIRELPGVEEAVKISIPTLAVTAGASVVILSVAFDLLPLLQYLFTAPALFFWRRRRKGYGVVYNAIAKTPVDLAVVRLFRIEDEAVHARGRLVKSRVTDKGGRYFFLVSPGKYRMTVTKPGFQFPSEYLKDEKTDGRYLDVYHEEVIEVTADNVVITANIPLDPSQAAAYHAPVSVRRRRVLRGVQHTVAMIGVFAATIFAILRPTALSIAMVIVQMVVYALVRRLVKPHKPISWGIVYNIQTGRPLSRVVARIFEPIYNKLLETQVTDSKGRYTFILGPNQYYATFDKQGFKQKYIAPIDYSQEEEPKDFSEEVPLEPEDFQST